MKLPIVFVIIWVFLDPPSPGKPDVLYGWPLSVHFFTDIKNVVQVYILRLRKEFSSNCIQLKMWLLGLLPYGTLGTGQNLPGTWARFWKNSLPAYLSFSGKKYSPFYRKKTLFFAPFFENRKSVPEHVPGKGIYRRGKGF